MVASRLEALNLSMIAKHAANSAGPAASPAQKGRILVVDDDSDVRFVVCELLRTGGYDVLEAADGSSALGLVAEREVDVILSDIKMPDLDGIELLRTLREREQDVPVLLMTGGPTVETAIQAVELGALRYLVKPIDAEGLRGAVEAAIQVHRLARWKREASYLGFGSTPIVDRASLEHAFEKAVDSVWIAYQPIVHASDGSLYGYEALTRTTGDALPGPAALFDAAERLNAVDRLGRVIRERLATSPPAARNVILFLNLHPLELADPGLGESIAPIEVWAKSIVLEITERCSLEGIDDLEKRISALRRRGYRIALDDLGAGYAGLTSFAALDPEVVKLDMQLVRGVDADPIKQKLVASMTGLCKELGILVVAEGVETQNERDALAKLGCDLLQGFLIGRPKPSLSRPATD